MGSNFSHCPSEGRKPGGCHLKFIRDIVTKEHDLGKPSHPPTYLLRIPPALNRLTITTDNTVLLPIKVVFYALAIALVLLMIGRQITSYRAKKQQAFIMKRMPQDHFADEDVEKGMCMLSTE